MVASLGLVACSSSDSPSTTSSGTGGDGTGGTAGFGGAGTGTGGDGTGGAGTSTATATGTGTGGAGGSAPTGDPIVAPDEQWTWIPFDNAFCGNGSTTGIGVSLSKKSSRVVIYLEGGGACWSELTCNTLKTASNFNTGF
ncbi:MAG: hypothetical protein ACMG6S_21655, partial [Byssovorax sp.]